ncbi:MAG: glutamate--cysteine ligase [Streptomycetales bacterium]
MGDRVAQTDFTRDDRSRFRQKVTRCLHVLSRMLDEQRFETERKLVGMEIELNIADDDGHPQMLNDAVLERIASQDFQTELGQFNIEVNIAPHKLVGTVFSELEEELRTSLNYADRKAREVGGRILTIGILPSLTAAHTTTENISANPRYALLNDEIFAARGEDLHLEIDGVERLSTTSTSILPEAGCTSAQFHLQVSPAGFPAAWNAAQAIAAVQLALGANAPFLFGRELWRETRIVLFEQATDTRPVELKAQGVRPRVWFGERWITGPLDLFEENLRYFPALLPLNSDEDPDQMLARGDVPHLSELRLHNGTIYRWNRPVYDVARGKPHLRVENRVLPAGPTVVDTIAGAAFYYGLVRALSEQDPPVWTRMSFPTARENFLTAARVGIDAELYWPGVGLVPATELVEKTLLPLASAGLDRWKIDSHDRDLLLAIIEGRCRRRTNGASWQSAMFHRLYDEGRMDRSAALRAMTRRYAEHMRSGAPVHTWPLG